MKSSSLHKNQLVAIVGIQIQRNFWKVSECIKVISRKHLAFIHDHACIFGGHFPLMDSMNFRISRDKALTECFVPKMPTNSLLLLLKISEALKATQFIALQPKCGTFLFLQFFHILIMMGVGAVGLQIQPWASDSTLGFRFNPRVQMNAVHYCTIPMDSHIPQLPCDSFW